MNIGYKKFKSSWDTKCKACGRKVYKNEEIYWTGADHKYKLLCPQCYPDVMKELEAEALEAEAQEPDLTETVLQPAADWDAAFSAGYEAGFRQALMVRQKDAEREAEYFAEIIAAMEMVKDY